MLKLTRHHDFQLFLSPESNQPALTNPPSFNWPQPNSQHTYRLELQHSETQQHWHWDNVQSPMQLPFELDLGEYRWRLIDNDGQSSEWFTFFINESVASYLPPKASQLFDFCRNRTQFIMYLDEDINTVKSAAQTSYSTLKATADLAVKIDQIHYPAHYQRGQEAGKRTAIVNVRNWIDRDLIALTLLYKIWQEEESGERAVQLLLKFAEWSPEGPASLLRPCTWGDEVGLSLARNLFLAYHWLSPLLKDAEKDFIRPMLIRIAYQMEDRLKTDEFHQYPGHSHTSRLPGYLGVAALVLHKEFQYDVCERWLNYALMVYRGVMPFYGGQDGSWAEGPFYSSSYSKWHHPFFLTVERLSDFSFYEHPFYKHYCQFAMDFVASEQVVHPFGDGFWCKRESVEWPGFFAQNPLRIYASRFGSSAAIQRSEQLEKQIKHYALHLLDVIPTVAQLHYQTRQQHSPQIEAQSIGRFYHYAGFGIARDEQMNLSFRASRFGNSSHRHADQGNFALIEKGLGVLTPTGSYGYCFGSQHHSEWTRTTQAHNLPLINGKGQLIDDERGYATLLAQQEGADWYYAKVDLTKAYADTTRFIRRYIFIKGAGVIVWDSIELRNAAPIQWRLHSHLQATCLASKTVQLNAGAIQYQCSLENHLATQPTIKLGYDEVIPVSGGIESDATNQVCHLEWALSSRKEHQVVASCTKQSVDITFKENNTLVMTLKDTQLIIDKAILLQTPLPH